MPEKPRVKAPKQRGASAKPRVKAPKQRVASRRHDAGRRGLALAIAGGAGIVLLAAIGLFVLLGSGGGESARGQLLAAGCTFKDYRGVSRLHTNDPAARPKSWNSFPPTSGLHYVTPAVYGFYTEPVELARILHGLEHGGIYMLYGPKTPPDTVEKLRAIYDEDPRGLIVSPLPGLGNKIALGAWTSQNPGSNQVGTGHLAKCTQVDEGGFGKFIEEYRGRGPQGVPLNLLQPGST